MGPGWKHAHASRDRASWKDSWDRPRNFLANHGHCGWAHGDIIMIMIVTVTSGGVTVMIS